MELKIKRLHPNAVVPSYATEGAACFDLTAATVCGRTEFGEHVWNGEPVICGTGLAIEIPAGHVMLVFSRSGHGFKNDVRLANCTGVIDSDYRGELMVKLTSDMGELREQLEVPNVAPLFVRPGDRVAQAMILPVERVQFAVVDELGGTARGQGGFGSTGA